MDGLSYSQVITGEHVIARRANVPLNEFVSNYLDCHRPIILSDLYFVEKALSNWTPRFFCSAFPDRTIVARRGTKYYRLRMDEFIHYVEACSELGSDSADAVPLYLRNVIVARSFPELLSYFDVLPYFLPNWLEQWPLCVLFPVAEKSSAELFIGPPGAAGPSVHRDRFNTHSWLTQIYGKKRVWMMAPGFGECLYPNPEDPDISLLNSIKAPDLGKFPRFTRAEVQTTVLEPGETIFIPAGWWHAAECLSVSISLSGNFVNRSNFRVFCKLAPLPQLAKGLQRVFLRFHEAVCIARENLCGRSGATRGRT